jgi:hypothetical protein
MRLLEPETFERTSTPQSDKSRVRKARDRTGVGPPWRLTFVDRAAAWQDTVQPLLAQKRGKAVVVHYPLPKGVWSDCVILAYVAESGKKPTLCVSESGRDPSQTPPHVDQGSL